MKKLLLLVLLISQFLCVPLSSGYGNYCTLTGFTLVSDYLPFWNNGTSWNAAIAVDGMDQIHIVWDDSTIGWWKADQEIMYASITPEGCGFVSVISENASGWNIGHSYAPDIAVDNTGVVHVVWGDETPGVWGFDREIMYMNYQEGIGWSAPLVVSDQDPWWNTGESKLSAIAVDDIGNIHVVWQDSTDGWWGSDTEIMYTNYTAGLGWANATIISDDETLWNNDTSMYPRIAVDSLRRVHVVWVDLTDGIWGNDYEIMYRRYTPGSGWSVIKLLSDNGHWWNTGSSNYPDIAVDGMNRAHIVWQDHTDGWWGSDMEIMYTLLDPSLKVSNCTVISDDGTLWNNQDSKQPVIALDDSETIHVVWYDLSTSLYGKDIEIMYRSNSMNASREGWSGISIISDNSSLWNTGDSLKPAIAIDGSGNVHVVWSDSTAGCWGSDFEILHTTFMEISEDTIPGFNLVFDLVVLLIIMNIIIYFPKEVQIESGRSWDPDEKSVD